MSISPKMYYICLLSTTMCILCAAHAEMPSVTTSPRSAKKKPAATCIIDVTYHLKTEELLHKSFALRLKSRSDCMQALKNHSENMDHARVIKKEAKMRWFGSAGAPRRDG